MELRAIPALWIRTCPKSKPLFCRVHRGADGFASRRYTRKRILSIRESSIGSPLATPEGVAFWDVRRGESGSRETP